MELTRRSFLKVSAGALLLSSLGLNLEPAKAYAAELRIKGAKETTTICPYCSCSCSIIVYTKEGKVINTEGDPDHPINEGALCPKGASLYQIVGTNNPYRVTEPLYRAPGATEWKKVSWDWALDRIARLVKDTRDKYFMTKNAKGQVVNRVDAIGHIGSAALDNEECYLVQKFMRSLGLVYIEHQARICHSPSVPALAESYGRGAMTNHWIDFKNSDVILNMGGNTAENHPMSMKWIMRAKKERGAKLIVIDPRFTRTAAKADLYVPIRTGTDIAFLGGLIKYIIDNNLYFKDYVVNYTDASFLVDPNFKIPDELDGVFSGYDEKARKYDRSTWKYQVDENGVIKKDPTLQDPRCVFQLIKRHYARYTIDMVSQITGAPKDKIEEAYKLIASTGKPDKVCTVSYAMGWTQHTVGTQYIRTFAIIQLLLGNIGMPGGGINAQRGEGNVQGSTDHGLLFHILPGYNPTPVASDVDLKKYIEKYTPKTKEPKSVNWWKNRPKYIISYLKELYGDKATKENDFCYNYLPKRDDDQNCSWLMIWDQMYKGKIKGFFAWGQNPACSGSNAGKVREALAKLDWLVYVNLWDTETSSFWRGPGMDPKKIKTEVFLLPCASSVEKEGSVTNSGRWAQWRYKAVNPPGKAMPDAEIVNELYWRVRKLYEKEKGVFPEPIIHLNWPYGPKDKNGKVKHIDTHTVAKAINGYFTEDVPEHPVDKKSYKKGQQVPSFVYLLDDGRTACGCWIYSGSYTDAGNMMARRGKEDPTGLGLYPNWAWCWPVNRRILYNRASVDPQGNPWDPKRAVLKWDPVAKKWIGDVPDGPAPPLAAEGGTLPFIMKPTGVGTIFGNGLADGPFPTHYEPLECPLQENPLYKKHRINPATKIFTDTPHDVFFYCDQRYPYVATTVRVTEHWQTGVMTRHTDWLREMQPQIFVEIDPILAKEKGIKSGDKVIVSSARGKVWAIAIVTERLQPLKVMGMTIHQVILPWHYGWRFPADGSGGDSANLLTPTIGDANTMIPETKSFMVNIEKA